MKERPILMNGDMVRAVLDGRKVQTRRLIDGKCLPLRIDNIERSCPFGQVGDRLWVRETFAIVPRTAYAMSDGVQQVLRPDDNHDAAIYRAGWERSESGIRWRPSIHMPRWASRITLEITGVRVERLQDISNEDIRAEGACTRASVAHRLDFQTLWESIYGDESWQSNPFVWVVEFRRVQP